MVPPDPWSSEAGVPSHLAAAQHLQPIMPDGAQRRASPRRSHRRTPQWHGWRTERSVVERSLRGGGDAVHRRGCRLDLDRRQRRGLIQPLTIQRPPRSESFVQAMAGEARLPGSYRPPWGRHHSAQIGASPHSLPTARQAPGRARRALGETHHRTVKICGGSAGSTPSVNQTGDRPNRHNSHRVRYSTPPPPAAEPVAVASATGVGDIPVVGPPGRVGNREYGR
jgi:hypothetical protein